MSSPRNLIVTGIPRSGTTLAAALIDSLEDAVCLSEPDWQSLWSQEMTDRTEYVERIVKDFDRVRTALLAGESVSDRRNADGSPITNYFRRADRDRSQQFEILDVRCKGLSPGFLLGMKHNAHYTCVLPDLVTLPDLAILAIIRHPIPTILSWRSLDLPVSRGRLPAADRFWPEIPALWQTTNDLLEVQVRIYGLFCTRYKELSTRLTIIKYEDLVQDPGLLERCLDRKCVRQIPIETKKSSSLADRERISVIKQYLRRFCPIAYELYPDLNESRSSN